MPFHHRRRQTRSSSTTTSRRRKRFFRRNNAKKIFIQVPPTLFTTKDLMKLQHGLVSSWEMKSKMRSGLCQTHRVGKHNIALSSTRGHGEVSSHSIVHGDLEQVDHKFLLCGRSDGGVAIFDTSSVTKDKRFAEISTVHGNNKAAHTSRVSCVQWFPSDTGLFTSSARSNAIKIWDPNTMRLVDTFKLSCTVNQHHLSPVARKHSLIAAAGSTGEVLLCDLRSGSSSHRLFGHESEALCVQWSPQNQYYLCSGSADKTIRMWDVRRGKSSLFKFDMHNTCRTASSTSDHKGPIKSHNSDISTLCFTSNGLWLISVGSDKRIYVWDTHTGKNTEKNIGNCYNGKHDSRFINIAVSHNTYPDYIYVPYKNYISVFDFTTGKLTNILDGHFDQVWGVVFNPVSMDVYSFSKDRNVIVWTPECYLPKTDEDPDKNQDCWSSDED